MAAASHIESLYERLIKPLPSDDRLRLLALLANDLAGNTDARQRREYSLVDLEGLGADLCQDVDPQEYVDRLRAEWNERP